VISRFLVTKTATLAEIYHKFSGTKRKPEPIPEEAPSESFLVPPAFVLPPALQMLEHCLLGLGDIIEVLLLMPVQAAFVLNPGTPLHFYCEVELCLYLVLYPADADFIRVCLRGPIPNVDAGVQAINSHISSVMGPTIPELPRENLVEFDAYRETIGLILGKRGNHRYDVRKIKGANISITEPSPDLPARVSIWGIEKAVTAALIRIHRCLVTSGEPHLPVPRNNSPFKQLCEHYDWYLEIPEASVPKLAQRLLAQIQDSTGVTISLDPAEDGKVRIKLLGKPVPLHYAILALNSHLGEGVLREIGLPESDPRYLPLSDAGETLFHEDWAACYL